MTGRHAARLLPLALAVLAAACGSSEPDALTVTQQPARPWTLADFSPSSAAAGVASELGFRIVKPSGDTLTRYRTGSGVHTGVHVIVVDDDLSAITHLHPQIAEDGSVREQLTFAHGGRFRVLVDAYSDEPDVPPNFQLTQDLTVAGDDPAPALPAFTPTVEVDGIRFTMTGGEPRLQATTPATFAVRVEQNGAPVTFDRYFGATAHAIFFEATSLAYMHTHVCPCDGNAGPGTGESTAAGLLNVALLPPSPGTWRLFLQVKVGGRVHTAPFTLTVT